MFPQGSVASPFDLQTQMIDDLRTFSVNDDIDVPFPRSLYGSYTLSVRDFQTCDLTDVIPSCTPLAPHSYRWWESSGNLYWGIPNDLERPGPMLKRTKRVIM